MEWLLPFVMIALCVLMIGVGAVAAGRRRHLHS